MSPKEDDDEKLNRLIVKKRRIEKVEHTLVEEIT